MGVGRSGSFADGEKTSDRWCATRLLIRSAFRNRRSAVRGGSHRRHRCRPSPSHQGSDNPHSGQGVTDSMGTDGPSANSHHSSRSPCVSTRIGTGDGTDSGVAIGLGTGSGRWLNTGTVASHDGASEAGEAGLVIFKVTSIFFLVLFLFHGYVSQLCLKKEESCFTCFISPLKPSVL